MTDIEKDFVENFNDYLQPIPKEIISSIKEKIKTEKFADLISQFHELGQCELETYSFYAQGENRTSDVKKEECRDALERYLNYLKILIKVDGFKTCNY